MHFLGSIGINIKLLISQIVNFGLLLWLLDVLLYKPILKRIEKDEAELMQVQSQNKQLEESKNDFLKQKIDADNKAKEIIKEAENMAEQIKKQAQNKTDKERQAIITQIQTRLNEIKNENKSNKK